jgi:hypothetical protein
MPAVGRNGKLGRHVSIFASTEYNAMTVSSNIVTAMPACASDSDFRLWHKPDSD